MHPTAKARVRAAGKRRPTRRKTKATTEPFSFPVGLFSADAAASLKKTSKPIEIKMPYKLQAVEQLAKLCGWNEPEKFEHGTTDTPYRIS
jgi:hypothetical protein